jgi:hypothetical protein
MFKYGNMDLIILLQSYLRCKRFLLTKSYCNLITNLVNFASRGTAPSATPQRLSTSDPRDEEEEEAKFEFPAKQDFPFFGKKECARMLRLDKIVNDTDFLGELFAWVLGGNGCPTILMLNIAIARHTYVIIRSK